MGTEIKVNLKEVETIGQELSSLQNQVANRKVNVNLVNTKGNIAEEVKNAASRLNEIRDAFTTLMTKTEKIVTSAKNSFENADIELAELFEIGESR